MDTNLLISNIGYCEMYEWVKQPNQNDRFGKFVQFSEEHPGKIEPYHNASAIVVGVSTVEAKVLSDDADFGMVNLCIMSLVMRILERIRILQVRENMTI